MKILYTTTIGGTMVFFRSFVRELLDNGHTVEIATNEATSKVRDCYRDWGCRIHHLSWSRSPFSPGNIKAISELRKVVKDGQYDIVHCHTPVAAMCTRLACRPLRKKGLKVIYTAHGFHFFKGAPLKNWLLYYPIEKFCSRFTDVLITINKEDHQFAQKRMKAKKVIYVPGVGIDLQKFSGKTLSDEQKYELRAELGIKKGEKMLLSVGELSHRKNHELVIRALAQIERRDWKYYIAGKGHLHGYLETLIAEHGLNDRVFLLGRRDDIPKLCECCDLFVFPSLQEGLPVALMEAIACKRPVICSDIRGNTDLIESEFLFDPHSAPSVRSKIEESYHCRFDKSIETNYINLQKFSLPKVIEEMKKVYGDVTANG